jgi:type VI secretion system protein ImpB
MSPRRAAVALFALALTTPPLAADDPPDPAAVARKVDSLNKLLEARTQLANLLTYMDGKTGAEEIIMKAIKDPALLQALASAPKPAQDQ